MPVSIIIMLTLTAMSAPWAAGVVVIGAAAAGVGAALHARHGGT